MSNSNGSGKGAEQEAKGFQFPGEFEITAMGNAEADLKQRVPQLLQDAGLKVLHETVTHRPSREGNYVAVRVQIHCESREQYEAAHAALRAHEAIHYTI